MSNSAEMDAFDQLPAELRSIGNEYQISVAELRRRYAGKSLAQVRAEKEAEARANLEARINAKLSLYPHELKFLASAVDKVAVRVKNRTLEESIVRQLATLRLMQRVTASLWEITDKGKRFVKEHHHEAE